MRVKDKTHVYVALEMKEVLGQMSPEQDRRSHGSSGPVNSLCSLGEGGVGGVSGPSARISSPWPFVYSSALTVWPPVLEGARGIWGESNCRENSVQLWGSHRPCWVIRSPEGSSCGNFGGIELWLY